MKIFDILEWFFIAILLMVFILYPFLWDSQLFINWNYYQKLMLSSGIFIICNSCIMIIHYVKKKYK